MGLLSVGTPLRWEEAKKFSREVRRQGIEQFIRSYKRLQDRPQDDLKWGDEVCDPSLWDPLNLFGLYIDRVYDGRI